MIGSSYGFFVSCANKKKSNWSYPRILFNRNERRRKKKTNKKLMHRLPFDCVLFGAHLSFKSPFSHFNRVRAPRAQKKSHFTSYPFAHNILLLLVFMLEQNINRVKNERKKKTHITNESNHSVGLVKQTHCTHPGLNFENLKIMHISIKNKIESKSQKAPIKWTHKQNTERQKQK